MTIAVFPNISPRLIRIPITDGVEITMQSLIDQIRTYEDEPAAMSYPRFVLADGKTDLGSGVLTGITAILQNAQIEFEPRVVPASTGTATSSEATGTILTDTNATFLADGVVRGAWIVNFTDQSVATVFSVDGEDTITHTTLVQGTNNDWTSGDNYKIWNITQVEASGGNAVAVDDLGATISSVYTSFGNQVVRTASVSSTLSELSSIQFSSFSGGVTIDKTSSFSGVDFPNGTGLQPVNNVPDAVSIANTRGFGTIFILGDITLDTGDILSDFEVRGESPTRTTITLNAGATILNTEFRDATIQGTLDGNNTVTLCHLNNITFVEGNFHNCILNLTITMSGAADLHMFNCSSGVIGELTPTIDMGGSGSGLAMRNYNGGITITNKSGADLVSLDMGSGQIILTSSVTAGTLSLRGVAKLTDNSVGATVLNELFEASKLDVINKMLRNRTETDPVTGVMTVYDDDDTVLFTANIFEDTAGATPFDANSTKILRKNRFT